MSEPSADAALNTARPPRSGAVSGIRAEFIDFCAFVRRPALGPHLHRPAQPAWRAEWLGGARVGRLLAWALLLWVINLAVLGPLAASVAQTVGAERRVAGMPPWVLAIVWAPIVEEMVFRYGLRRPALAVWLLPLFIVGLIFGRTPGVPWIVAICALLVGVVLVVRRTRWSWQRNRAFRRAFPLVFHASTLAFACLHLINFKLPTAWLWLLPLLILPQWVTGLVLGWMRVRFGIGASIMLHALFNAGPMTLLWALTRWGPGLPT